mmetsp:Transcript_2396/g.6046  ORF Transcript_2396/g.6046 Transcript_2396/m.6046 type:complete len:215 (-) Transcript_2396:1308-1952(-)
MRLKNFVQSASCVKLPNALFMVSNDSTLASLRPDSAVLIAALFSPACSLTLPPDAASGLLPSEQPSLPGAHTSTATTPSFTDAGVRGLLSSECSRKWMCGPNASSGSLLFQPPSRSNTWSSGQGKGRSKRDPGMRPACGAHQRSSPHHSCGTMSARPVTCAMASALRMRCVWWLTSAKWPCTLVRSMRLLCGPAVLSSSSSPSIWKVMKPPGWS